MLYYDKGGYKLDAQASSIKAICIHVSSTYSDAAIQLILQMADYLDMTNHVQNYPAAASAYAAALKGLRTANADTAGTLLQNLKDAIAEYAALLDGTQYTVSAAATQNGSALTEPAITLTDAYGNVTTGTGGAKVIAGDYKFSVSDGGYNRTDGTLTVSADTQVSVTLPYGEWFGNIRLLDADKEPYRVVQNRADHTVEYWIEDTASALSSVYLNAAMGKVPDTKATKLRTIYTGTNGRDMSNLSRSWNSTATSLTYLLTSGMENRTFPLEAQYTGSDGYTQIQSYTVTVTRVPTLKSLAVTAEGTKLPLNFEPTVREYSLTTVSTALDIAAAPFDEGYTVTGSGAVTLSGDSLNHTIQVTAPNGERNSYTLHIQKVASVPVTLNVPSGTTVQVFNGAGSEIAPVDGTYHLVPGESYADTGSIALTYTIHVQKSDPIQLTIQTTPAEAIVFLTNDLNGKRIVEKNGTYSLTPGASYSYTTTCAGYIGQKVEHYTAPDKDGTLTITLEKAPANGTLINFDSAWPHLRQNNENNGVVDYRTPVYAKDAELYWATSIGSGYDVNACGCPILVDGAIYTYSGSRIYKVDAISGEILIDKPMDHNSSFAINPPTYANGMIFVGLSDGTIQAFDANTLNSLWIYRDSIGGQPNSSIVYHDGYIYTGFWVGEINEAHYVCLSATDEDPTQSMEEKLPTWYYTSKGGFYWAGAYVCDDFLLIGTDDGASGYTTGRPSLLSFNPKTGELLSSYKMNVTGDIRSSITHYNGKYYFTSKGGYFFEASVDAEGNIEDVRTLKLYNYADDPANPAMSTCTPTIYNGRAYIGISGTAQFGAYSGHNLTVIDIPNWEIAYTVRTHGYPQTSGVLTTAYKEETGCVYVYFFDNFTPGKLRVLEDRPGQTEVSLKTMETYTASGKSENYTTPYNIFTPSGAQAQYAICSPIMDEYGTIYFKNDSAYLMAVGSTIERIEVTKLPDKTTYKVKDTFDPTGMQVTAYYANGKTRDITAYVTWSETPLTANDTDFQITFPYAMYQNRENSDTLEMEYGVHCDKPMTTLTLTIEDTTEVKYGDVNGDGKVASTDAAIVYRYANGKYQLSADQLLAADVNGDGVVNSTDAALIYRMANGKLLKFPVEKEKQSEQTTD